MKELVEVIAKALVDDPDSVAVSERQDGRTTVKAAAAKEDKKVVVDIIQ